MGTKGWLNTKGEMFTGGRWGLKGNENLATKHHLIHTDQTRMVK